MSKHTPGPWVKVSGVLMGADGTDVVASGLGLGLGQDSGDGVRQANTRLIAAAPELLQVLIECLECEFSVTEKSVIEKALSVIAKATGEQA